MTDKEGRMGRRQGKTRTETKTDPGSRSSLEQDLSYNQHPL